MLTEISAADHSLALMTAAHLEGVLTRLDAIADLVEGVRATGCIVTQEIFISLDHTVRTTKVLLTEVNHVEGWRRLECKLASTALAIFERAAIQARWNVPVDSGGHELTTLKLVLLARLQ